MYSVVIAVMKQGATTEETYAELLEKRTDLAKKGWTPYGTVMYHVNAVSQAMTLGTPDMSRVRIDASPTPRTLEFRFGGEGVFGTYYDVKRI